MLVASTNSMSDRFCSQCGSELVAGARFCIRCGRPLGAGAGGAPRTPVRIGRWAPLAVFGAVLVVGAAAVLAGRSNPIPPPSLPGGAGGGGPGSAGAASGVPGGEGVPPGHPPIEIPADVVKTIGEMRQQAEAAPDDLELWGRLAGVQYRAGMIDKGYLPAAMGSFEHVLERDPKNLDALRYLGNIAFDQQQPVRAIDYYVRYLSLKPGDPSVTTDMATMYLSRGDAKTAIQFYQQVLEKEPAFFEALFNLGIAVRSRGDAAEAVSYFERARAAAPDDRARQQVDQMIARLSAEGGAAAPGQAPPAAKPGGFRAGVEAIFRDHPMIGPKLEAVEWESDDKARVVIREFPMQGMPPEVRQRFTDRLRAELRQRKTANQVASSVSIELVDPATGSVMETIVD
jgi:hypothetical protein